jgi:hypothetical protein
MARINVEDSIYTDLRFYKLLNLFNYDADKAIGCLVRAWRVGQPIWKETKLGIPLDVWKTQQLRNEIIECGLARIEGDRIWLNGANEAFKFLEEFENRQSKGGKARANSAPRNERGQFVKEDKPSKPSDGPATVQLSSLTSPSYSYSSSSSSSFSKEECVYNKNAGSEILEQDTHINSKTEEPKDRLPRESKITKEFTEQITQLKAIWLETIQSFNSSVKTLPLQTDIELGRLVQINGYEQTRLALLGARFEERTENFDPSKNLNIRRFFKQNIFEKFVILGQRPERVEQTIVETGEFWS